MSQRPFDPNHDVPLAGELIGEILALRAVLAQCVGGIALLAGKDNNFLDAMRTGAMTAVASERLQVPGINAGHIKARAEVMVDKIFDSINVTYPPNRGKKV